MSNHDFHERLDRLDRLDHVAIPVEQIDAAVEWYTQHFRCEVQYQDDTWALLALDNIRLALVVPHQHPPHIAVRRPDAARYGALTTHRDGTRSVYVEDPSGNSIEILEEERA